MFSIDRTAPRCRVLATDLDGTFIPLAGDETAKTALVQIRDQTDRGEFPLAFVTGRHLESVLDAIVDDGLPMPGWILCDVGTSIYTLDASTDSTSATNPLFESISRTSLESQFHRVTAYDDTLDAIVGKVEMKSLRDSIGEFSDFRLQESFKQGRHKLSYYVPAEKLDDCRLRVEAYIEKNSLPYGIISSIDPFNGDGLIDVLPTGVSKAFALDWWCQNNGYRPDEVVFCGDSGNDLAALVAGYRAVVVGNAARSLALHVHQSHADEGWTDRLFLASGHSTSGVIDGLRWFGLLSDKDSQTDDLIHDADNQLDLSHAGNWGAVPVGHHRTRFRLFAPAHELMSVQLMNSLEDHPSRLLQLRTIGDGWHELIVDHCPVGTRYNYAIGGQLTGPGDLPSAVTFPDPASRFQPAGVHGPSQVVSSRFPWQHDASPRATRREDCVVYELHLGAFTENGTYLGAIDRLDELIQLGVTAIELMPIAECPGRWNWGYDGTHWFAPMHTFGTPDDFRRFIDAAHGKGLLVFADVVYNHFGPEGNYWSLLGDYLTSKHHTPWGAAPNFDEHETAAWIRRFVIDNAIYWLDEFHLDGLRVDAIHCMADDSEEHITRQFGREVRQWSEQNQRRIWLIAESNVYDAAMIDAVADGGTGFDAQWCDDFAHSLFAVIRPQERLTVRTYQPGVDLTTTLDRGFVFQGNVHGYRGREATVGDHRVDTSGLIYCIQNHDFIGNHPTGQRLHHITSLETQASAAALLLLSPAIPMLFMGEEFACEHPFAFFVDFGDETLKQAVINGRQREYPQHDWSTGVLPTDELAYRSAKLGPADAGNAKMRSWYRDLIKLRKRMIGEGVLSGENVKVATDINLGLYSLRYRTGSNELAVLVRLSPLDGGAESISLEDVKAAVGLDDISTDAALRSLPDSDASQMQINEALVWTVI